MLTVFQVFIQQEASRGLMCLVMCSSSCTLILSIIRLKRLAASLTQVDAKCFWITEAMLTIVTREEYP